MANLLELYQTIQSSDSKDDILMNKFVFKGMSDYSSYDWVFTSVQSAEAKNLSHIVLYMGVTLTS